eukprot:767579-Hanusia_phi.AAC.12
MTDFPDIEFNKSPCSCAISVCLMKSPPGLLTTSSRSPVPSASSSSRAPRCLRCRLSRAQLISTAGILGVASGLLPEQDGCPRQRRRAAGSSRGGKLHAVDPQRQSARRIRGLEGGQVRARTCYHEGPG